MPLTETTKRKARRKLTVAEPADTIFLDKQSVQVIISQYGDAEAASKPLAQLVIVAMNRPHHARERLTPNKPAARTFREMAAIRARLKNIVQEGEADRWLATPNTLLGGISPREAIAHGRTSQVSEILVRLEEGIYV